MRRPLSALAGLSMLASLAQAQLSATVSPNAGAATDPAQSIAAQLPPAPTVGSDNCATAEVLGSAVGAFGYDNQFATTGTEGQISFLGGDNCNYGCAEYGTGNVQVPGDVWFSWVSPVTNRVRISTCPVQQDTKIAVYNGPACPASTSCVACNDDWHGFSAGNPYQRDSMLYFDAIAGAPYLIQVGRGFSAFTAGGFIGTFNIEVGPLPRPLILDDSNPEVSFSIGAVGNGNCRFQRFGNVGDVATVLSTDVMWGWIGQTGLTNGTPCVVAIWEDLNSDGNPNDGVLMQQVATTYQSVGTGVFVNIPFSPPVTVNGIYFIGVASQLQPQPVTTANPNGVDFPLTADTSSCETQPDTTWYGVNTAAPYDVTNPGLNSFPSTRLMQNCQTAGTATYNGLYHSSWTIRSNVQAGPPPLGTGECFGDTAAACPCSASGGSGIPNPGLAGHGCANTVFPDGALLTATGMPFDNVNDTVVLTCSNMTGPGLFIQSNGLAGPIVNFNDGQLCAAAGIIRLGVVFPSAGVANYPGGLTPNPIHIQGAPVLTGGVPTPDTKHYQCWYRDIPVFCNPPGHNMSNGISFIWLP